MFRPPSPAPGLATGRELSGRPADEEEFRAQSFVGERRHTPGPWCASQGNDSIHAANEQRQLGIVAGAETGTLLVPGEGPLAARKQWLAGGLKPRGRLVLDAGAARVLLKAGRSLLAVGEGDFGRGELVSCVNPEGREVGRGLINYSAQETARIRGQASDRIEAVLGYVDEPELIHRDNLVIL